MIYKNKRPNTLHLAYEGARNHAADCVVWEELFNQYCQYHGSSHLSTLLVAKKYGASLLKLSRCAEAEAILAPCLQNSRKILGKDGRTLDAQMLLAEAVSCNGRFPEALRLWQEALDVCLELYGDGRKRPKLCKLQVELHSLLASCGSRAVKKLP